MKKKLLKMILTLTTITIGLSKIEAQNVGVNTTGALPDSKHLFEALQTGTTDNSVGIYVKHSGADATKTLYGFQSIRDGAGLVNVAAYLQAINGTSNYALIVPSGGGNVGIGVSSPDDNLVVSGNVKSNSWFVLDNLGALPNDMPLIFRSNSNDMGQVDVYTTDNLTSYMAFSTATGGVLTQRMTILSNGNVGIGTATPDSPFEVFRNGSTKPSYDAQTVASFVSTGSVGSSTYLSLIAGSAGSTGQSGIFFGDGDDQDIGKIIYHHTSDEMSFWTGTTEKVRINPSGNVGIGTTAPGSILQLESALDPEIRIASTEAAANGNECGRFTFYGKESAGNYNEAIASIWIEHDNITDGTQDASMHFSTTDNNILTEAITLKDLNVGIGTTTPSSKLDVNGDIEWKNGSGTLTSWSAGSDMDGIITGSTFGSHIKGQANGHITVGIEANDSGDGFAVTADSDFNGTQDKLVMFCKANGNVGIGTASPSDLFHVSSTMTTGGSITIDNTGALNNSMINQYKSQGNLMGDITVFTNDNLNAHMAFSAATGGTNTEYMRIEGSTGNIGIGCATPTAKLHVAGTIRSTVVINTAALACSDSRFKKNVTPITSALNSVLSMNGVTYYWRKNKFPQWNFNDKKQVGFIAQDLELIYPELVNTDEEGYKSVDYAKLAPILVEAIKEQQQLIEMLKKDNKLLKTEKDSEVGQLKAEIKEIKSILNQQTKK